MKIVVGLIAALIGLFCIFEYGMNCQKEKCQKMCGLQLSAVDFNTKGSDKCYCTQSDGELKLKGIL